MTTFSPWKPQWTTPVKIEAGGRFPLGLNRFHNGLEEILIKSITWLANRLRYFTYSCWAIGDIERHTPCEDWSDFVEAFRRRESALAIGLYLLQPDYSVAGSTKVSKVVSDGTAAYDCSFSIMESNSLGAFGLYYLGTTYNLGLIENDENGVITLTPAGWALYDLAEKRYRKIRPDYWERFRGKRKVPVDALLEWGLTNDFDNIRESECRVERDYYKSLIFRLGKRDVGDYRRDTFAFFLECIDQCVATGTTFSEDTLTNIHYYSHYFDDSATLQEFSVPGHFDDVHFYWAIYEGHVYFRWWLSRYFQMFLEHLKVHSNGSTPEEFLLGLDWDEFDATIAHFCGTRSGWFDATFGDVLNQLAGPPALTDPYSEELITKDKEHESSASVVAKFAFVMAGLWHKFRRLRSDPRYQYVAINLSSDLWFDVLFQQPKLRQMSLSKFLSRMLKRYVLDQHDRIMIEKNDLRRCWFTTEQGRYFFQADVSLIGRPAKYGTIMNFLGDMGLIEGDDENTPRLSAEGQELFEQLKREYF